MALQPISGQGLLWPEYRAITLSPQFASIVIDATGEKFAWTGRFWHKDRTSKTVERVGFRPGTVVKAGGSGWTLSLQNLDNSASGLGAPDETQDQTVAVSAASLTSNTWLRTGTLSAGRSLAPGEAIAVVIEFDGSGRLGADSLQLSGMAISNEMRAGGAACLLKTASWAVQNILANIVLECSDGTFGTLSGAWPLSAINTHAYKQDTAGADEYAMEFSVPFPCKTDGAWISVNVTASTSDFDVILYDSGGTALGTVSFDGNTLATARPLEFAWPSEITLAAGATYRLAIKPTQTTSTLSAYTFDVADANHLTCHTGGTALTYTTRLDAGSWAAATTTRRLFGGIRVSALDDGTGGGSGGGLILGLPF